MKNNKFTLFMKKVFKYFSQYHVIVTLIFVIPAVLFFGNYFLSGEYLYENLYFGGQQFDINHDKFAIKEIKPLKKIIDISSYSNYQGGTCYENYYLLCSNNFECILIYNTDTLKVENTVYTGMMNTDYHCNTLFFGEDFYSSDDKFPILYVSMENIGQTIGFRLYDRGGVMCVERVQTIELYFDNGVDRIYYPNSYYDYESNLLYYAGYTKKSYRKADDNYLRYYAFHMPDYRLKQVFLDPALDAYDSFTLDSETATQGGFIADGHLYQTFSFNHKDLASCPKFRVVDLKNKTLLHHFDDIGQFGQYDEFENVAVTHDRRLFAFGITTLTIYEFIYTDQ